MLKKLHLLTKEGKTFSFKDVTIIEDNETIMSFIFLAVLDGKKKVATIFKSSLVGFTTLKD